MKFIFTGVSECPPSTFITILNHDFIYRQFFIFSYYSKKVILVYEKFWLKKKKKINLQVLKSSAISTECLEFVKIIWKFEIYEKICYCQVEKVIIFITKIAKYF